ncbi:MAG: NUDIX domain-containing protein [Acidiferrobacterales bacterium]
MKKFKHAVFIGRFQPFHLGHLDAIRYGKKIADELTVVIGSSFQSRSIRNPFSAKEREYIMQDCGADRFVHQEDDPYDNERWRLKLQMAVNRWEDTAIIGLDKDDTTWYLKFFPDWKLKLCPDGGHRGIEGTLIRQDLFSTIHYGKSKSSRLRSHSGNIDKMATRKHMGPLAFDNMCYLVSQGKLDPVVEDYVFIYNYRKQFEGAPFPPVFVTTDAVVTWRDKLLMIRRGGMPGKGKLALPGGFLEQKETLLACALRELREETGVVPSLPSLGHEAFDYPYRSARGRNITHGYYWDIPCDTVVAAKAGDDAGGICWVPLGDLHLYREQMMSDHYHIARHFLKGRLP